MTDQTRWAVVRLTADKYLDPQWRPDWEGLVERIDKALDTMDPEYTDWSAEDAPYWHLNLKHGVPVLLDHDPSQPPTALLETAQDLLAEVAPSSHEDWHCVLCSAYCPKPGHTQRCPIGNLQVAIAAHNAGQADERW